MIYQIGEHILVTYLAMVVMTAIKIWFVLWPRYTVETIKNDLKSHPLYPLIADLAEGNGFANLIRTLTILIVAMRCGILWPKEIAWDIKWISAKFQLERLNKKYGVK